MDNKSNGMPFKFKDSVSVVHCFKNFFNKSKSGLSKLESPDLYTKDHVYYFMLFYISKLDSNNNIILSVLNFSTICVVVKASIINSNNEVCNTKG